MARTIHKRRRLIAAQAALVFALIVVLYFGLLRPSSVAPLTGAGVPGKPHNHLHAGPGVGNGHHGNGSTPGQGPSQSAGNPHGGGPLIAQTGTPAQQAPTQITPRNPTGPTGDQYLGSVAALKAKLGIAAAKAR